jgi:hypothetical protein
MDFITTGHLLILYFCICKILEEKWEYTEAVHQPYIDCRSDVLYNVLFVHDIPIKLVRLIKMCFNETCSTVHLGEHL